MKAILVLVSVATFVAVNAMAADTEDCGKIKTATFETNTGVQMSSGKTYIITGASVAPGVAAAISQDLDVCVYGIYGDKAYGLRIKR